jgi:hypothetical protein
MPLIRDFIAEHDHVVDVGDRMFRALDDADTSTAAALLADAKQSLVAHWRGEESGIFTVMAAQEDEYAEYVDRLVREHRELAALLDRVDITDAGDQLALKEAFADLAEHITREEDGLFPASLTALTGDDWDASMTAWHEAHPGQRMIPD